MRKNQPVCGYFKVEQSESGLFDLYQSHDKKVWVPIQVGLTLQETMELQVRITNSNILNYMNFISILKNI
jgi:hypothetical protein